MAPVQVLQFVNLMLHISLQDSLPDQPSLLVPASVYDYVAGLSNPEAVSTVPPQLFSQDSLPRVFSKQQQSLYVKEGKQRTDGIFMAEKGAGNSMIGNPISTMLY